jgi:hypothetical protein
MVKKKIVLKNTGSNLAWFNYQKASTLTTEMQVKIEPGQSKTIFTIDGTLNWDNVSFKITILSESDFS